MKCLPFTSALLAALALLPAAKAAEPLATEGRTAAQQSLAPPAPAHDPIPAAPAGLILDQAHVLLPEIADRLGARLVKALPLDVHVYVVTTPTLNIAASKQLDRIQELATAYSRAWNKRTVGAIILFDDESGLITVDLSKTTNDRFTSFAVEDALRAPLGEAQSSGLAREKIERFGEATVTVLSKMQADYLKEQHRALVGNLIIGSVALVGLGLAVFSAASKPKKPSAAPSSVEAESKTPLDF